MNESVDAALLFPPHWYFDAVPADLSGPAGALRAAGLRAYVRDLSAETHARWFDGPGFRALQQTATYSDREVWRAAVADVRERAARVEARFRVRCTPRQLAFHDIDEGDVRQCLTVGMDAQRNPALPVLAEAARQVADRAPRVVGIALVHPEQRVQAVTLGRLIRQAGYRGCLALYGSYEDVLTPEDLADDLRGRHDLWHDFDGAIVGEAESALVSLAMGEQPASWLAAGSTQPVSRTDEDLEQLAPPDFGWVRSEHYSTPVPVVDLRLGRGCPWARCAFCAIQAHQVRYRVGPIDRLELAARRAAEQLETCFVRLRDDLLTPTQLTAVAGVLGPLGLRWTGRVRFGPGLTRERLEICRAGGLDELWVGLESAVPRVREAMDKGVDQRTVLANLDAAAQAGVAIRALCLLGFPGETEQEARATLDFLEAHWERIHAFSVTPFQLMRRSPMADDPGRWGVTLSPDPVPSWSRLRHTAPFEGHVLSRAVLNGLLEERTSLWRRLMERHSGPSPLHDWIGRVGCSL